MPSVFLVEHENSADLDKTPQNASTVSISTVRVIPVPSDTFTPGSQLIRGLSQKVVDFLNSKKSLRVNKFLFCRNIGLSFFNILSVFMTNKIKRNHFYGHSISVRYASPAHAKIEMIPVNHSSWRKCY